MIYELDGNLHDVIFDDTARAFLLITGTLNETHVMNGTASYRGPLRIRKRLACVITDDD